MRRTGLVCALLALILAVGVAASTSARYSAACSIPIVNEPPWGFHAGEPIAAPSGSYSRGHGNIDRGLDVVTNVPPE